MTTQPIVLLCLLGTLVACGAGSGEGLDNQGQPITGTENETDNDASDEGGGDQEAPSGVTLAQLQAEIFSPVCATCHIGSAAPQGLRLDSEDNSFAFLVGVDANEIPTLKRVAPGDPENSYLVHKVEGRSSIVGSRMPLGQSRLSDDDIDNLKRWIAAGAKQSPSSTVATRVTSFQAVSTSVNNEQALAITLTLGRDIHPDSVSTDNVRIQHQYSAQHAMKTSLARPAVLRINGNVLNVLTRFDANAGTPDAVEVTLNPAMAVPIQDNQGRYIDGDHDHQDGGTYRHVHTVE